MKVRSRKLHNLAIDCMCIGCVGHMAANTGGRNADTRIMPDWPQHHSIITRKDKGKEEKGMGFDKGSVLTRRNAVKALMVIYDAVAVNAAYFLALILRFYVKFEFNSGAARFIPMVWQFAPFYAVASVLIFYAFRL